MFDPHALPFWGLIGGVLNALLLPLFVMAILGSITGGSSTAVMSVLSEGLTLILSFTLEITMRLMRCGGELLWQLGRVACRTLVYLYAMRNGPK